MGMNNFSYQQSQDYPSCEDGAWHCQVTNIQRGKTKSGADSIDFSLKILEKDAEWNGVPFRKSVIDGDYFDKAWSQMCDCFSLTPEQSAQAIHNFSLFKGKTGFFKFAHEKNERQTDAAGNTQWVKVFTEYTQITPLKPTSRIPVGKIEPTAQVQESNLGTLPPAPEPTPESFPEDIPF